MSHFRLLALLALTAFLTGSCQNKENTSTDKESEAMDDTAWIDLSTLDQWHCYNKSVVTSGWSEDNGVIAFDPSKNDGGDLVTNDEFEDFELSLEWKIDSCGNSGIMWAVYEADSLHSPYLSGPEMQILDDDCHADGNIEKHRAGDLYDLIACSQPAVNPVGDWNLVNIRSEGGMVTFHLNDIKVVEFQMGGEEWDAMVANSKFSDWEEFGKHARGKIALQDHGDKVWFKNVKIRHL